MANELWTQVLKNDGRNAVVKINFQGAGPEPVITGGFVQGVVDGLGVTGTPGTTHLVTGWRFDTSDAANHTKVYDDYPKRIKKIQYGHEDNTAYTTLRFEDNTGNTYETFNLGGNGEVTFPFNGLKSPLTGDAWSLVLAGSNNDRTIIVHLTSIEGETG